MSIAAFWLIVAVILLRIVLKKAPKWISCALWILVAIRLLWNLPAIKEGDSVPELTAFNAHKWRSGLGAYFFGQCTAQKNADGTWSYTVGTEMIS